MDVPMPNPKPAGRRNTLKLRIKPDDQGLIDRAAQHAGKTKVDLVLEAARRAAEDALLERTPFVVGPETFDTFRARRDEAPHPNDEPRCLARNSQCAPTARLTSGGRIHPGSCR